MAIFSDNTNVNNNTQDHCLDNHQHHHSHEHKEGNYDTGVHTKSDHDLVRGLVTSHRKSDPCDVYFHGVTKGKEGCGCIPEDKHQHEYSLRVAGPADRHQIKPETKCIDYKEVTECPVNHEEPCEDHVTVRRQPITLRPMDPCDAKYQAQIHPCKK